MHRLCVWAGLLGVLTGAPTWAKANGIVAGGCDGCHGSTPLSSLTVQAPATVNPGQTISITASFSGSGVSVGGLYLTAGRKGTLTPGAGMKSVTDGLTHSAPKAASNGTVSFTFNYTPPSTPDGVDIDVFALGGNGDNRSSGDKSGQKRLSFVFGCSGATYYADFDGDGHGNAAGGTVQRCSKPAGYAALNDDCDDNDERIYPGAVEACNGRDDNCNQQADEGLSSVTTWPDLDGDGFGDAKGAPLTGCSAGKRAPNDDDCNDADPAIRPGAKEVCNVKDDNCDGRVDEGVRARCGTGWCERLGPTCDVALCMPGDPVKEICNALDDDCDGVVDDGALCPGGSCYQGECVEGELTDTPDSGGGASGGGSADGGSLPKATQPSCAAVDGNAWWLGLALVACMAARRRSRGLPASCSR